VRADTGLIPDAIAIAGASAGGGFYAADLARQQKAWMEQMQQAWLSALPGAAKPAKKRSSRRRSS